MIQMLEKDAAMQRIERFYWYIVQSAHAVLAEANGVRKVAFVCIVHIVLLKGQV
jgi:hypothetical protein